MRRPLAACTLAITVGACELQEVVIAEAEPFVVVESILTAGLEATAALHASVGGAGLLEPDAVVQLIANDTTILLERTDPDRCLAIGYTFKEADFPGGLACYAQPLDTTGAAPFTLQAGAMYRLSVRMSDGSTLEGATRIPGVVAFALDYPFSCYLEPLTQADLIWNSANGAAAYIIDLRIYDLEEALANEGIDVDVPNPLILRGVSIGEADTSIVLPAEIGVFDRFGIDPEAALALQRGLPHGVRFTMVLAAVDENYVDWVRGGDFNPSGPIRTPSLFGDAGTGVFASMTIDNLNGSTDRLTVGGDAPPCSMS